MSIAPAERASWQRLFAHRGGSFCSIW